MEYMKVAEAAIQWNITPRQVQKLCKTGQIEDVLRDSRNSYLIPKDAKLPESSYSRKNSEAHPAVRDRLPLPIGVSGFKKAVSEYYYVDKTLLIKELLDVRPQVALFTRPRRFGKTLNMDMLRVFFERTGEDTGEYFRDKKIWSCGERYREQQGRFPVIFMTFKDAKFPTWGETLEQLRSRVRVEYSRHRELKDHPLLSDYEHIYYQSIVDGSASDVDFCNALSMLCAMLDEVNDAAPIVIIDEYDTPIQEGHVRGYYDEVISFMRNFFSAGLKDNTHLSFAFMTGILRVAKESIFSGMNNLKIYSVMDRQFSRYFGFVEEEVKALAAYYGVPGKMDEIRKWYDGYHFGDQEIYNPWSVMNYFSDQCVPKAFWQSTGSNEIIGEIMDEAAPEVLEDLQKLMQGQEVAAYIDTGVIYPEIRRNPTSIFSFLLVAGYLKYQSVDFPVDDGYMCRVRIPNREIAFVYEKEVLKKYVDQAEPSASVNIKRALYRADVEELQNCLNRFLLQSVSYFDTSSESFYHGLMLGLCAAMNDRYELESNREGGDGRFDILMKPKNRRLPGIIMELKSAGRAATEEVLKHMSRQALSQMEERQYFTELSGYGCGQVLEFGIAFCEKTAAVSRNIRSMR